MHDPERTHLDGERLERLLGIESSKVGFYSDVKQKIRELEAINLDLRTKKNELQAVFDSINDGVAIFDSDCRVQYRNHVCPRLFPGETILEKSCQALFHPEHSRGGDACPVEAALQGETRNVAFTRSQIGRTRYFEATSSSIEDPFGKPSRALVFFRDVTERRLQEIQLMQAEKMSSVGVLAAGVAHEINNPLTSVAGYAEALERRLREAPELLNDPRLEVFPKYLQVIVRESYRCKGIIESLLSFSRKSDGSMAPVDISGLVSEVLDLVSHRGRYEQVAIHHLRPTPPPPVWGDAAALRQVILNLTMNALQAIDGNGRVNISTFGQDGSLVLKVDDNGCGIHRELLDRIWDPFYTGKAVGEGLGLGLAVTYNIVHRHGGQVAVESEVGVGTTFTVTLPARRGV